MLSLSNILKVNALSSGATGILLFLFPHFVATLFGVNTTAPFIEAGIFLILFALFVFGTSVRQPISRSSVKMIIALDTLWVVASGIAILFLYDSISLWGTLIIAGVALWVAMMALLQSRALRQSVAASNPLHGAITA